MATTSRVAAWLLFLFCVATTLIGREQAVSAGLKSPVITAAASGERLRFSSPGAIAQIRVQILSLNGDSLFDSAWKDGDVLDWTIDSEGQRLANGSYRCVVMVKDLEGNISQREAAITAQSGQVSIEQRAGSDAMTIEGSNESAPRITLLAHDGTNGSIVSTSGDLSFRFGNFLAGKDSEQMRLTADGDLHVEGLIRANKGIVFSDGTVLTTATGVPGGGSTGSMIQQRVNASGAVTGPAGLGSRPGGTSSHLTPRPTFAPAYQFVVGDSGVSIGTTNPAYNLDVTGTINTASLYNLGGNAFVHNFGTDNTFVGILAGNFTLSGGTNTGFGKQALGADTNGTANTAVGFQSLASNTGGSSNTAVGRTALVANTSGVNNTAVGASALGNMSTGVSNTAVGSLALVANATGCCNTAVGASALEFDTDSNNTAVGLGALANKTSGGGNIAIGYFAGNNITSGSNNIEIGNAAVATESNTTRIGFNQTRAFIAGIRSVTTGAADAIPVLIDSNGQLGTASSSRRYKFDVNGMSDMTGALMRLRPVTFRYLAHGDAAPLQYGLIAEEVAEVYPELVTRNKDGEVDTVMYQFLAPMLLNEVQKQHRQIEEQQKTIDTLLATLNALGQRVQVLEGLAVQSR